MDRNGEVRIQRVLAKAVVDIWRDGNEALSGTNHVMGDLAAKIENAGGIILINRFGKIGYARNTTQYVGVLYRRRGRFVLAS